MRKAKAAFGGLKINFKPVEDVCVKDVFGTTPLTPAEMISKIWAFIRKHGLSLAAKSIV